MKAKIVTRFLSRRIPIVALAVLALTSYSTPMKATGGWDIDREFYTGCLSCPPGVTNVGGWEQSCVGNSGGRGQQSGDWKEEYWINCDTDASYYYLWECCNGAWQPRSGPLGACE